MAQAKNEKRIAGPAPGEEPADLTTKRQRIARAAITSATALYDVYSGLKIAQLEATQSGNFVDSELTGDDLGHVSAYLIGLTLTTLVPELETFLSGRINNDNGLPVRRDLLLQLRR
jgi:hypothetical protein